MWLWQAVSFREDKWVSWLLQTYWSREKGSFGRARTQIPQNVIKAKITNRCFVLWEWSGEPHSISNKPTFLMALLCQGDWLSLLSGGPSIKAPLAAVQWTAGVSPACTPLFHSSLDPCGIPSGVSIKGEVTSLLGQRLKGPVLCLLWQVKQSYGPVLGTVQGEKSAGGPWLMWRASLGSHLHWASVSWSAKWEDLRDLRERVWGWMG